MDGFSVEGRIARPAVDVDQDTRERLIRWVAAIRGLATPEDASRWLADGFPAEIDERLAAPLVREECSDHVDVALSVLQAAGDRVAV